MNCIRCGKTLDAEAQASGACQYCGQAIQVAPFTAQIDPGLAPGGASPGQAAKSSYSWRDWPATVSPPAAQTQPTLPRLNTPAQPPAWESFNGAGDDKTELGPRPFASGSVPLPAAEVFGPNAAEPGTAAFIPLNAPPAAAPAQPGPSPTSAIPFPLSAPPPGAGVAAAPAYPPAAPARSRRRRALILACVAAFVIIALISGGLLFARSFTTATTSAPTSRPGTPAASPTATAPATHTYRDPNGHFTISYPATWSARRISQKLGASPLTLQGVQFQGGNASLKVLTGQALPFIPNQAAQADMALLQVMGGHNISSADPKRIGGQDWTTKRAQANNGDELLATSITYQGELYSIVYSAPSAEFSQDETQVFTPMLNSFAFGA